MPLTIASGLALATSREVRRVTAFAGYWEAAAVGLKVFTGRAPAAADDPGHLIAQREDKGDVDVVFPSLFSWEVFTAKASLSRTDV